MKSQKLVGTPIKILRLLPVNPSKLVICWLHPIKSWLFYRSESAGLHATASRAEKSRELGGSMMSSWHRSFFPFLKEGFSLMNCGTPRFTCEIFSLDYHRGSSSSRIVSSGIYGDLIRFHGDFMGVSLGFHGNRRFFEIPPVSSRGCTSV